MTPTKPTKRQAAIIRLKQSLSVPKHYSINTTTTSDADKTRLIQKGTL